MHMQIYVQYSNIEDFFKKLCGSDRSRSVHFLPRSQVQNPLLLNDHPELRFLGPITSCGNSDVEAFVKDGR